jgi:hypothetical protein
MQRTCACGSGKPKRDLIDARGIFCAYVCDDCEASRRGKYRDEIFTNAQYDADEPIEDD